MPEEKLYIGAKLILGIPMDHATFRRTVKGETLIEENQPGYKVTYPDGYVSWSPQSVFETAYREVTAGERELF